MTLFCLLFLRYQCQLRRQSKQHRTADVLAEAEKLMIKQAGNVGKAKVNSTIFLLIPAHI